MGLIKKPSFLSKDKAREPDRAGPRRAGAVRRRPSAGASNGSSFNGSSERGESGFNSFMEGRRGPPSRASLIAEGMAGGSGRRAGERAPRQNPTAGPQQHRRRRSFGENLPISAEAQGRHPERRARSRSAKGARRRGPQQGKDSHSQLPQPQSARLTPQHRPPNPHPPRSPPRRSNANNGESVLVVDEIDKRSLRAGAEPARETQRQAPPQQPPVRMRVEYEDPVDRARSVARAFMDEVDAKAKNEAKRANKESPTESTAGPEKATKMAETDATSEESPVCVGQSLSLRNAKSAVTDSAQKVVTAAGASPVTAKPTVTALTNNAAASQSSPKQAIMNANEARMRFPPPPPRQTRNGPAEAQTTSRPAPPGHPMPLPMAQVSASERASGEPVSKSASDPWAATTLGQTTAGPASAEIEVPMSPPAPLSPVRDAAARSPVSGGMNLEEAPSFLPSKSPVNHTNVDERLRRLAESATGRPASEVQWKSPLTRANVDARITRLAELPFAGTTKDDSGEGAAQATRYPPPPTRSSPPVAAAPLAPAASVPTKKSDGPSAHARKFGSSSSSMEALNSLGALTGVATAPGELDRSTPSLEMLNKDLEEARRQLSQARAAIGSLKPPPPRDAAKAGTGEVGGAGGSRSDNASFLSETRRQLGPAQEAIALANPGSGPASPVEATDVPPMPTAPKSPAPVKPCLKPSPAPVIVSNTELEAYIAQLRKEFYGARKELEAKAQEGWMPPAAIWVDPTLAALEDDTMSAVSTPYDLWTLGDRSVNGLEAEGEGDGYVPSQPAIAEEEE